MPPVELKSSRFSPQPHWKIADEHPVGRRDREQVEQDRLERDHDRAERDQQQQEREQQDEAEHERRRRLHLGVEVVRLGGAAPDRVLDAGHGADGGGHELRAQRCERVVRDLVGAAAGERDRRPGTPSRPGSSRPGSGSASRRRRAPSPSGRRSPRGLRVLSPPLIATTAPLGAAREGVVDDVERLQLRLALRQRVEPAVGRVEMQGGQGERDEHRRRRHGRDRPGGGGRAAGSRPRSGCRRRCRGGADAGTGSAPSRPCRRASRARPGSTVSEPIMATATTIIVPIANDMNVLSPESSMPAIAMITVKPEISTARPDVAAAASIDGPSRSARPAARHARGGGRRASSRRRRRARSAGSLVDRRVHRHELAGQRDEAHRREDGGQPDQDRHERRDGRAEHEQQDHEREDERDQPGLRDARR